MAMVNIPQHFLTAIYESRKEVFETGKALNNEPSHNNVRKGSKEHTRRYNIYLDLSAKKKKAEYELKEAIISLKNFDRYNALLDTTPLPEDCIKHILGFVGKNLGGYDDF